jgi:type IV secretion system protein VirB6
MLQIILLIISIFIPEYIAASPGKSCIDLSISEQDNDYYNFIQKNIEATDPNIIPSNLGCNNGVNSITIGVFNKAKNVSNILPEYDLITFNPGDTKKIFNTVAGLNSFSTLNSHMASSILNTTLTAVSYNGSLCLNLQTSDGFLPLICKSTTGSSQTNFVQNCKIAQSCYDASKHHSKSAFNFSGMAYYCAKESLDQIFYSAQTCIDSNTPSITALNPYASFQSAMRKSILASLLIYLIFFGYKIILEPHSISSTELIWAVLKIVLVIYFSLGLGTIFSIGGVGQQFNDGITQIVVPILLQISSDFAHFVFSAVSNSGLCSFSPTDYPVGYGAYALWDSIDCRFFYYLFGDMISFSSDFGHSLSTSSISTQNKVGQFFSVVFLFIFGGQIFMAIFLLMFSVYFISMCMTLISSMIISLVAIYALAYMAPLFVPMSLFEQTKQYFDAWWKLMLSFAIRPAVYAGFIALTVSMVDNTIYGNCEFQAHNNSSTLLYTLKLPTIDPDSCTNSIGMKMQKIARGTGLKEKTMFLFSFKYMEDVLESLPQMMILGIILFIFYHFSTLVANFAADITGGGGVSTKDIEINPQALAKEVTKTAAKIKSKFNDKKPPAKGNGPSVKTSES